MEHDGTWHNVHWKIPIDHPSVESSWATESFNACQKKGRKPYEALQYRYYMQLHAHSHIVKRSFCQVWFQFERPRILRGFVTAALAMPSLQRCNSVCRYTDYRVIYSVSEDVISVFELGGWIQGCGAAASRVSGGKTFGIRNLVDCFEV